MIRISSLTPFGRKFIQDKGWEVMEFKVHDAYALRRAYRLLRKSGETADMARYFITSVMTAGKFSQMTRDGGESWT